MQKFLNSNESKLKHSVFQKPLFLIFILFISLTCFRCANMQRPTGGPKDSIPPKLLGVSPENLTRNFNSKEIILQFDEYIKLTNQFKEFSISPDLDRQPEFKVKKKALHIILPDSLDANTTYTINFGKGLVDYNEGNPFVDYNYVFATGNQLDSLSISGTVKNAFTKGFDKDKDKEVKVILIPTRQDSIFGKRKANIFALVDTAGNFKFNNLREDTYRIYALKEQNNDRIFNSPDESIGFLADSIVLNKNVEGIRLEFSKGLPLQFRTLEKKIEKSSRILLTFNQPVDAPTLRVIDPQSLNSNQVTRFSNQKDSAFIYLEKLDFDSIKFELQSNNNVLDTILIRRGKAEKYERTLVPIVNINNKVDKIKHITLTSDFPIKQIDKEKILILEDSVSRRNFQLQKDSIDQNKYHIRFNWKAKRNYELVIQENAILSPFNDTNKEFKRQFTLDESDNYGDIKFTISGLENDVYYIVELINESKDKVFDTKKLFNTHEISYNKFPGGKYSIRIFKDLNNNGRWDGANVYQKTQAEPIWYYDKTFTIRANWEQTEKLEPTFD